MIALVIVAVYLLVGLIWAILLYMEMAPLVSKREHLTFWTLNVLAWPIVVIISTAMRFAQKQNK